ncbi:hypothetical protein [Lysinibacillus sphaericus]|uniref:hypothetical protein n=1 Tax=Lysinibacillus sphaericus TaxID=1421 RepID=UPI003D765631
MNIIIFPGDKKTKGLNLASINTKNTENQSNIKLLSQAFKALNDHKKKIFN